MKNCIVGRLVTCHVNACDEESLDYTSQKKVVIRHLIMRGYVLLIVTADYTNNYGVRRIQTSQTYSSLDYLIIDLRLGFGVRVFGFWAWDEFWG